MNGRREIDVTNTAQCHVKANATGLHIDSLTGLWNPKQGLENQASAKARQAIRHQPYPARTIYTKASPCP